MDKHCQHFSEIAPDIAPKLGAISNGRARDLETQRWEEHLQGCADCEELSNAWNAARDFADEVDLSHAEMHHLQSLHGSLEPYFLESKPKPKVWLMAQGLTPVLAMAGLLLWGLGRGGEGLEKPVPNSPSVSADDAVRSAEQATKIAVLDDVPFEPADFVHGSLSGDHQSAISRAGDRIYLNLESGSVAASFRGGGARRLELETPDAKLRVVGTRFSLSRDAELGSTLYVAEGEVLGRCGTLHFSAKAGESKRCFLGEVEVLSAPQKTSWSYRILNRTSVLEHHAQRESPRSRGLNLRFSQKRGGRSRVDWMKKFADAEALALGGQPQGAYALWLEVAQNAEPALAETAWLELAVLAESLGDVAEAERIVNRLVKSATTEVGRQAKLMRCTLAARRDDCAALRCLLALEKGADHALSLDARRTRRRQKVSDDACELNP